MTRQFAASLGKFRVHLFFAVFLAVAMLAASPALADHVVTREEVLTCKTCTFSAPKIDVSRGYPVIISVMTVGDSHYGLVFARSNSPRSSAGSSGMSLAGGNDTPWQYVMTTLSAAADTWKSYYTGACGDLPPSECLRLTHMYKSASNAWQAIVEEYSLDENGNFTGKKSSETSAVPWDADSNPSAIGPAGNGMQVAGWVGDQLSWLLPGADAPVGVADITDFEWSWADTLPPVDVGVFGDDNTPYWTTIDVGEVIAGMNDDQGGLHTYTQAYPDGVTIDEQTTVQAGEGDDTPTTSVSTSDGREIRYIDVRKPDTNVSVNDWPCTRLSSAIGLFDRFRGYIVRQCFDSNKIIIRVGRFTTGIDSEVESHHGYVEISGLEDGQCIEDAKRDDEGNLHIAVGSDGTDDKGNIVEKIVWFKVTIDESKIFWTM